MVIDSDASLRFNPPGRGSLIGLLGSPLRNLLGGVIFVLAVMAAAVTAYVACGWQLSDAIYMVVLTVYTVGYDEVRPVDTPVLRGITIALIVLGCTGMIFLTGALIQLFTASQLRQIFGHRRMTREIDALDAHVIICGFGRIGAMLARELRAGGAKLIILERGAARLEAARADGFLVLAGDATDEAVLVAAGIGRARALATVLPDDAANVFITLSARGLNRQLSIIARGEAPSTEKKLLQAGADRVILPAHIGAERIAEIILFPEAGEMMARGTEAALRPLGLELEIAAVEAGSRADGASIASIERAAEGAFLIGALTRRDGAMIAAPRGDVVIGAGDGVTLVGRSGRAEVMTMLFSAPTG